MRHITKSDIPFRRNFPAAALLVLGSLVQAGCAQPGPFASRQAQVGALRESVSQLESEKGKLEREVADLSGENRRLEERLVQEQAHSDQLSSRLDDARRLSRGVDLDGIDTRASASNRRSSPTDDADRRTTPANRRSRKTPFAQIPGEIRPLSEDDAFAPPPRRSRTTPPEDEPAGSSSDLFSSQDSAGSQASLQAARQRWLSIARDSRTPARTE
jgi:hypothetical protein